MQANDRRSFAELLTAVHSLYRQEVSALVLEVWWQAMLPFDLEAVRDALNRHAVNPDAGHFCPKPADVVKLIQGGTQDEALVASAKVLAAVRRIGSYASVAFDDPIIHAVLGDMGGWIEICKITEDEWPHRAREFETRYRGYRLRGQLDGYPLLVGRVEGENASRGFKVDPPKLIGNPQRAALVLKNAGHGTLQITQHSPKLLEATT